MGGCVSTGSCDSLAFLDSYALVKPVCIVPRAQRCRHSQVAVGTQYTGEIQNTWVWGRHSLWSTQAWVVSFLFPCSAAGMTHCRSLATVSWLPLNTSHAVLSGSCSRGLQSWRPEKTNVLDSGHLLFLEEERESGRSTLRLGSLKD